MHRPAKLRIYSFKGLTEPDVHVISDLRVVYQRHNDHILISHRVDTYSSSIVQAALIQAGLFVRRSSNIKEVSQYQGSRPVSEKYCDPTLKAKMNG